LFRIYAQLKFKMFVLFCGLLCTAFGQSDVKPEPKVKLDIRKTMQIFEGVSIGFFLDDKITIIEPCLGEFSDVTKDVKKAFEHFKVRSASNMLKGLYALSKGFGQLPDVVEKCGASKEQVDLALDTLTTFRNPLKFFYYAGKNLLLNGVEIFNDLKVAKKLWDSEDWLRFGHQVGFAMHKIALGYKNEYKPEGPIELNPSGAKDIVIGLTRGLFLEDVAIEESCVKDAQDLWFGVQKALAYLKKRNKEDASKGLIEFARVLKSVNLALKECNATEEHVVVLEKAIAILQHPKNFTYVFGKHLVVNDVDIYHELRAATDDWNLEEFQGFGFELGFVCSQLLERTVPNKLVIIEESTSLFA